MHSPAEGPVSFDVWREEVEVELLNAGLECYFCTFSATAFTLPASPAVKRPKILDAILK